MPTPPPIPATSSLANLEAALLGRLRTNKLKIPPYPAVATKLQALARGGRCTVDELAAVVSADPALVAAILGRATSAAHAGGQIATVRDAISRIGVEQLIQLALAAGLGEVALSAGPLSALRRDTWRCALLAGRLAHDLAARRQLVPDTAFIAGLLHDFGAVVLVSALEDVAKEIPLPTLSENVWRQFVGKLQVQFGMVVASRWHLPEPILDVIAHHHDPENAPATPLTGLVKLVDRVIAILDRSPTTGVAALLEVKELATDERYQIGAALPEVVAQMASYAATASTASGPSKIAPTDTHVEDAWPVDFDVVAPRHDAFRARQITANTFEVVGKEPLLPNWLAEVTLHVSPEPIVILVNVKTCEHVDNAFIITMQPFGLGGSVKQQWQQLVGQARGVLSHVA